MKALSITLSFVGLATLIVGILLILLAMKPATSTVAAKTPPLPAAAMGPPAASSAVSPQPKTPRIMLIVKTAQADHAWINYWAQDGIERGAHIVCTKTPVANPQQGLRALEDILRLFGTKGTDLGAWKDLSESSNRANSKTAGCQVAKRTWHYTYGESGQLVMVEGDSTLGPVRMPN